MSPGFGGGAARPVSAPPGRGGAASFLGSMPADSSTTAQRARVEELRQIKEAGLWGRDAPPKRDLPAFWSLSTFGQPYNDERLASSVAQHWKLNDPKPLNARGSPSVGPATEQQGVLRLSLQKGRRLFDSRTLGPLPPGTDPMSLPKLTDDEREAVLLKLPPPQRIHALRNCLDRDIDAPDFTPWTQVWDDNAPPVWNGDTWRKDAAGKEFCIRLALQKVETLMRQHLKYLSDVQCRSARAPSTMTKDLLRRAFWKVDPARTGTVSLQQFMQVWQNVLQLNEYDVKKLPGVDGKMRDVLEPKLGRRRMVDRNVAAALFVKYGFDKDGNLPYVVFVQALCESPARLLGHEVLLDNKQCEGQGKNGLKDETDVALCVGDAKIMYRHCNKGVFPPSGFNPQVAFRSRMAPRAHQYLEHVYGYAGADTSWVQPANNLFYTHNTTGPDSVEIVYYVGAVGVVMNKSAWSANREAVLSAQGGGGKAADAAPVQKFFFGHDNDITCLALHPGRKWVATGQQAKQKEAWEGSSTSRFKGSPAPQGGKGEPKKYPPYVCIWDVDRCEQLQRLDHGEDDGAVLAACFSGNPHAANDAQRGGNILVTVTADAAHTIHVWRWMRGDDKTVQCRYIPGWYIGPHKKLAELEAKQWFYGANGDRDEAEKRAEKVATTR